MVLQLFFSVMLFFFLTLITEATSKVKLCKSGCAELETRCSCALWAETFEVGVKKKRLFGLCSILTFCPLNVSVVTVYLQNGFISWIWLPYDRGEMQCVRLRVCQPRRPKWRQPSRFAVQTRTILVEMLHKCFSQYREIALPSSGPEGWMASKSDCNCEGMLVHHLILLPSVKLTEPGASPYFVRKSWM